MGLKYSTHIVGRLNRLRDGWLYSPDFRVAWLAFSGARPGLRRGLLATASLGSHKMRHAVLGGPGSCPTCGHGSGDTGSLPERVAKAR